MKFLNVTLLLVGLCAFSFFAKLKAQTQQPLDDFYKNYYGISSGGEQFSWTIKANQNVLRADIFSSQYQGLDRQKWLVMPTHPESNEYLIVEKSTGRVADTFVAGGNDLKARDGFLGNKDQVFKLVGAGGQRFFIFSPLNSERALTRKPNGGTNPHSIFFLPFHGGSNQQFRLREKEAIANAFTSYLSQNNIAIPQPPAPTSLAGENLCIRCNESVVGETIIPFVMVSNDMPRALQTKISPYYKVVRKQFWKMVEAPKTLQPGFGLTVEYSQTKGITQAHQSEVSTTLNMGFSSEASVAVGVNTPFANASASASVSFSKSFGISQTQINSFESSQQETITYIRDIGQVFNTTLYVEYQLVDKYILERMDGTEVITWEVEQPSLVNTNVAFPTIDPIQLSARKVIASKKVARTPIQKAATVSTLDYSIDIVSANPFAEALEVEVTAPAACQLEGALYTEEGEKVKDIHRKISEKGTHTLAIKGEGLDAGVYILKMYIKGNKSEEKVYEYLKRVMKK